MSIIITNHDVSSDDPMGPLIAARVRREREQRGWSIAVLADVSGVSRAMISKVERAEASPTAALLGRLSGAFGLTISTLLARAEADGGGGRLMPASEQAVWTDPDTGYVRRALSPPGADPELVHIELPPGREVLYPPSSYAFMRGHCVWVMSGELVIHEDEVEHHLKSGDCFAFDLTIERTYAYANPSAKRPARYVVALTRS